MKKVLFILCLFGIFSCGEVENEAEEEIRTDDFASQLADAKASQDGKDDEPSRCGEDTCQRSLCGYDCSVSGQQCERACADDDTGEVLVKLNVSGSISKEYSSENFTNEPILSLNDVLIFGCDLWDFSSGDRDDLVISYSEVHKGAFAVGDTERLGPKATFEITDFQGPGSYQGDGFFTASSDQKKINNYFLARDACGFEVEKTATGISGNIVCANLPITRFNEANPDASIKIEAEFSCGIDAMDPQFIKLNRKTEQ